MDSGEPDTQPTPRPRPVKRAATKRAAPATHDPRVAPATTRAPAKRSANGASRASTRREAPVDVDATVDLPSPTLPPIVPAETVADGDPARERDVEPHDEQLPAFPVEAPLAETSLEVVPDPLLVADTAAPLDLAPDLVEPVVDPEPIVTFVDPATMEPVRAEGATRIRAPRRSSRPRVRRVTRVVRHVDTWSVFKVALVFDLLLYAVCLTSGVLLWRVASATGTIDNAERFFEQFGWSTFEFRGGEIYHAAWVGGLFVVVGLTGVAVLLATLFNLITDLVGGIRVSVLEEEVVARQWNGLGAVLRRDELQPGPPADADDLPDRVPRHPF